jgi:NTP pyrophosphatase (non-canonical NTP hydrolase)
MNETHTPTAGMQPNDYQTLAARTLIDKPDSVYTDHEIMLVWNALGLAGEAGEVSDTIKKAVFHQHGIDRNELIKELGDVLWYVAALCTNLDVSMSEVMERNIAKLKQRYPDGYSSADSLKRTDVQS